MSAHSDAGPSYTVLRIKRKATEPPLSSLVIQDPTAASPAGRGFKKRIISSRHRGVFRLAETVPETWEARGEEAEGLKGRIARLLAGQKRKLEVSPGPPQDQVGSSNGARTSSPGLDTDAHASLAQPTDHPAPSSTDPPIPGAAAPADEPPKRSSSLPFPPPSPLPSTAPTRPTAKPGAASPDVSSRPGPPKTQYRVVPPLSPRTKAMLPPRIRTYADDEAETSSPLVFVDAQAVSVPPPRASAQEEEEMASFLPMLQEYLKLDQGSKQASPAEEYVYDLYYRDVRETGSTPLSLGAGDGVSPLSVGALIGFESYSPPSTPSDSEPEDEADEDSNEEDYYRNDYPEDEDADEDMREYGSSGEEASEDELGRGSEESEEGGEREGGIWGYR